MTRVNHRKSVRKPHASKARRCAAPPSSSENPTRTSTSSAAGFPISDALALCGVLLRTLGPDVVLDVLGRLVAHGADAIFTLCQSAHRAAELARSAAIAEAARDAVASRPRRRRPSRTTTCR